MAVNFDFSKIKSYNQSQNNGFEELICQLAHLEKIERKKTFVRKEGAGGDAGIECYWKLENEDEIGWQAKYFIDGMDSSRWGQLDKSFKTALEKHPKLTKFIVCLPINKTDSRKTGKAGKKVVSVEDEWNIRLEKWNKITQSKGRSVNFEYWGKHEIVQRLTIDNPHYSGRALYWFNEPIFSTELFKDIANKARECLGERYTPEFHINLPIAKSLDGLGHNKRWWDYMSQKLVELSEKKDQFFRTFFNPDKKILDKQILKELELLTKGVVQNLIYGISLKNHNGICNNNIEGTIEKIIRFEEKLYSYENDVFKDHESDRTTFYNFFAEFRGLNRLLQSLSFQASKVKAALVYGDPGIGKSHLLCDLCLHRIEDDLPTVFLLGNHYTGGNPINFIKNALDVQNYQNNQILGALDAAGEAKRSRTMIVIDAINEGPFRDEWYYQIRAFLFELSKFDNLCLLISCRSTYLRYMFPDTINNENLVRIHHIGFQGYEHRAAEKYLSQQGISKPSAPILAPEFTNPLFLKTCCQALKSSKATTFPKGLHGITSLFDFYLQSIEATIARKKAYNPSEEIIKTCLTQIASSIFPDNLDGMPSNKARKLVNENDPNPSKGESLFNEFIYEGILSEDISYKEEKRGKPVIRFTYERFSDHFIAQQLIENYDFDNISNIFTSKHPLGQLILENRFYALEGIFEALSILLAEKFSKELVDLLPQSVKLNKHSLSQIFFRTIVWRSPNSFTDRTLELLNKLNGYNDPALDVLLMLSTEPGHPWNAEFLHRNLIDKTMSQRDSEWSILIANKDFEEQDGEPESVVRTLIDWSCFGDISEIEQERARLCAVILIWFLTTSNRRIRDQSTKSLVRLLTSYPELLNGLIDKFYRVNDLYLLERLYAVIYGVVCNCNNKKLIKDIAQKVYNLVFKDEKPIPHILLRDYARGILEFANHIGLLQKDIDLKKIRPPYNSEWPLENPSEDELDSITGDKYKSKIRSSLMGFPGDFGNYTMECIHDWSPTPISKPKPKLGREYKKEFAETHLKGELKKRYLKILTPQHLIKPKELKEETLEEIKKLDTGTLLKMVETFDYKDEEEKKKLHEKISSVLKSDQKEYFRWLSGIWDDRPAAFSRKWAQRWVCKRAYSFGWTYELFGEFELSCSYSRGAGYGPSYKERIGKKYQWIAFHEFLAHISDNVHWIDRGYEDLIDNEYFGPWQIYKRDIDPTVWIRENGENSFFNEKNVWWQKYKFPFEGVLELEKKKQVLWSEKDIPDFPKILCVQDTFNNKWLILRGHWHQSQKNILDENVPKLDGWFRINSLIVEKGQFQTIQKVVKNKSLVSPDTIRVFSTQHQSFLKEYPWHVSSEFMTGWREPDDNFRNLIPIKHFVPISQYEWESGNTDYSVNKSLSFYLPAKEIVEELELSVSKNNFGAWIDKSGNVVFMDPSVSEKGASYALFDKSSFLNWLNYNNMEIIWLIGGEKMLFSSYDHYYGGRFTFNGIYKLEKGEILGELWFK